MATLLARLIASRHTMTTGREPDCSDPGSGSGAHHRPRRASTDPRPGAAPPPQLWRTSGQRLALHGGRAHDGTWPGIDKLRRQAKWFSCIGVGRVG